MSGFGVYLHFPYCRRHCPYCDFNVSVKAPPHEAYRDAVLAELAARAPDFATRPPAGSLYFGGGTPGLWRPDCVGAIVEAVERSLGLSPEAEITLEFNPEDTSRSQLQALRVLGVNRLSLGLQSFDDALLQHLGRAHCAADNHAAMEAARAAGFENLSVDLIWGAAGQSVAGVLADAAHMLALQPEHISTYELTVEEKTSFGARARRGEVLSAPEGLRASMYESLRGALRAGGVLPYEISNAARPGREAVHNRLYWTGGEYLALGAGAHGFRRLGAGGERWANERHAGRWMRAALAGRPAETFREALDAETIQWERLFCGLRLDAGLEVDAAMTETYGPAARRLAARGSLEIEGDTWRASPSGRLLLDSLLVELSS